MGGSTANTPATPESLRVSDADRDRAVNELRTEFVDGRLSHETFVYRMQTALDARNRGQLAHLFTDLPPRRTRLLARIKTVLRGERPSSLQARAEPGQVAGGPGAVPWGRAVPETEAPATERGNPAGYGVRPAHFRGSAGPAPFYFPPGRGDRFTIGRTRDCDLCLTDLSVSRLHAELVRGGDGWLLNDLGSHNGTRLNGWLVRETVAVRAGDRLEFGSLAFVVQDDPPAAPGLSGKGHGTG